MLIPLLIALSTSGAPASDWTALALPSLCEEHTRGGLPALDRGTHLSLDGEPPRPRRTSGSAMTANEVSSLLGRSAQAAGVELELFPYAPPLLARGAAEDLAWAREELAGLERAGARQRIELSAVLYPGELGEDAARALLASASSTREGLPAGARLWRRRGFAGETVAFGQRQRQRFLADYTVNVATDSGVAAPLVGSVFTGKTLHLRASRVDRGRRVHLRGWLDLAEAGELELFDPRSPDLGRLEQPSLYSLSLGFSGVTQPGRGLRVHLGGAPLAQREWTLYVFAETDAEPRELGDHDWLALDVSLLTDEGTRLPAIGAGAGLGEQVQLAALETLAEPLSAAGILTAVQPRGRNSRSGAGVVRSALHVGENLLLLSAARAAQDEGGALDTLIAAMESSRLRTDQLTLVHGELRVEFPVAEGEPARLVVGRERTLLVGYEAEIAPNTWMPKPLVERSFDGLAWQGRRDSGAFRSSAWLSATDALEVRSRDEANMGALQLPRRRLREGAARLSETGPTLLLRSVANSPALVVELGSS